jgi:cyclophilin family peptidyl-prolyl cis-trans isomerase
MKLINVCSILKLATLCALALMFSACGGGESFQPVVTGVKVLTAQYGRPATIYIGGKDLRSNFNIDTSGSCINPTFASNSSTDTLVLNCSVIKTGDYPMVIRAVDGMAIYSTTLNIPKPQVALITSMGSITVELDPMLAPLSSNNFLNYVNESFYRGTLFHRVIPNFVVQGGGFSTGMFEKLDKSAPIELESNKGLSNLRGSLAMARTNLHNSATSQFYINLVDNLTLDYKSAANPGYAVFGKVVQGMDVIDTISAVPTGAVGEFTDVPLTDVTVSLALRIK